jgi:hypothetical protein
MIRMSRLALVAALGLAVAPAVARADEFTDEYFEGCARNRQPRDNACTAYMTGFWDGLNYGYPFGRDWALETICWPSQGTTEHMADIVVKFMREHPELRHMTLEDITVRALREAWPCEQRR